MSGFDFYFSFYGLLLGLCVAQVASGLGHAVVIRRHGRLGLLTPMLAVFLLLDIASFWIWAWDSRQEINVDYTNMYLGLTIALSYYLATVLLFPVRETDWADLDAHYWQNKSLVLGGIGLANLLVIAASWVHDGVPFTTAFQWFVQAVYWASLVTAAISGRAVIDKVCLGLLIAVYASTVVI